MAKPIELRYSPKIRGRSQGDPANGRPALHVVNRSSLNTKTPMNGVDTPSGGGADTSVGIFDEISLRDDFRCNIFLREVVGSR